MPALGFLGNQLGFTDGDDVFLIVELVAIVSKKLEQQVAQRLFVLPSIPSQVPEVVIERTDKAFRRYLLLMGASLETRENGGISGLEEVDNQAYPRIGAEGASKSYLPTISILECNNQSHFLIERVNLPASFRILRFVQCFTIMAKGRMRSSISMYVRIIRVFSKAKVLFTFMSHARRSSGSQIFTMGTLACETQTTRSMPSVTGGEPPGVSDWSGDKKNQSPLRRASTSASRQTCSSSLYVVVIQMSTVSQSAPPPVTLAHIERPHTIRFARAELIPRRAKNIHFDVAPRPLIVEKFLQLANELTAPIIALRRRQ